MCFVVICVCFVTVVAVFVRGLTWLVCFGWCLVVRCCFLYFWLDFVALRFGWSIICCVFVCLCSCVFLRWLAADLRGFSCFDCVNIVVLFAGCLLLFMFVY